MMMFSPGVLCNLLVNTKIMGGSEVKIEGTVGHMQHDGDLFVVVGTEPLAQDLVRLNLLTQTGDIINVEYELLLPSDDVCWSLVPL